MQNCLIVGPAWIGDMIMAQSLLRLIKNRYPTCHIDLLAPGFSVALAELMPEVRRGMDMPFKHGELNITDRWILGKSLQNRYDCAIVLPNSFKSALVPFFAKIPERRGWSRECRSMLLTDSRKLDKARYPLMIQRFMALGLEKELQLPAAEDYFPRFTLTQKHQTQVTEQFALSLEKPAVVLCPGAEYGPAKRWPTTHFAAVANAKIAKGWQVWLLGGPKDTVYCDAIAAAAPGVTSFAGRTNLTQAAALMALSQMVVSNDSGLMHLAAAVDKPLVALYGSSSPDFTPPLSNQAVILSKQLACSPCFARECQFGHTHCLTQLSPDKVLAALASFEQEPVV